MGWPSPPLPTPNRTLVLLYFQGKIQKEIKLDFILPTYSKPENCINNQKYTEGTRAPS